MSIIPALLFGEEIALATATTSEAIGSDIIGSAIVQKGVSVVSGVIEETIGNAVDAVYGQGTYENFEKGALDNYADAKLLGLLQQGDFSTQDIAKMITKQQLSHKDIAKTTGDFINDLSRESIGDTIPNVLAKLEKVNPVYYYLANKMMDLTDDFVVPTNENYLKVSAIYNGSVFFNNDVVLRNGEYYGVNEGSFPFVWKLSYNNYPVVPPIWGTWTGINSPNNKLPYSGIIEVDGVSVIKQSQLDKISFSHDSLYKMFGSFNEFADDVLISYIQNGLEQGIFIFPNERETAIIALNYFSSLGKIVRAIYGDDKSEGIIASFYKDIYNVELTKEHIGVLRNILVNKPPTPITIDANTGEEFGSCPIPDNSLRDFIRAIDFEFE